MLAVLAAAVVLVAISFAAGAAWNRRADAAGGQEQITSYACPMHPEYHRDAPGDCPSCGMRLEPVRTGSGGAPMPGSGSGSARPRPGSVHVSPERQQAVGVRLGLADRVAARRTFRTTGRVAADENATYPLVAGTSGWVRTVGRATTGTLVRKNERLASIYSPEFVSVMQSYYTGLDTAERAANHQFVDFNQRRVVEGVQRFADTLRNMGVSESQLQELRVSRELVQDIYLMSPVNGFILQRNVSAGLRFDRGFEFYRVADLATVWILADVYQREGSFIRPGITARVTAQQNRPLTAVVSDTEPVFDADTLTLTVRLEMANPGFALKPGMFVDVEFPIDLPAAIVVPADAIVDSGLRKIVFVDLGGGYFEPRQVETGWHLDDQVEITKGLMAGERIVMSGTFLIDSESRLKAAPEKPTVPPDEDPVCGMQVHRHDAAGASEYQGRKYYFCSTGCKTSFDANPASYAGK
jgi:RND family efflux transporter MFP subunit